MEIGLDQMIDRMGDAYNNEFKILELQNFLKNPPLVLFNLSPSQETGEVTFKANLKPYSQLYVVAIDLNSVAQKQVDLADLIPT